MGPIWMFQKSYTQFKLYFDVHSTLKDQQILSNDLNEEIWMLKRVEYDS